MIYTYIFGFSLLLNVILGIFVLSRNVKSHINISFSAFVFTVDSWMVANYLSNFYQDYDTAFLWNKLIFIISPYISFALLYFSLVFPYRLKKIKLWHILLTLIPIFISNAFTYFNYVITGINFLESGVTGVIFGWAIYYFGIQFLIYVLASIAILTYKYFKSNRVEKLKILYLLFGIGILTIFGTITNLVFPLLFDNFDASNIGPLLSLFVFGFTAYSIVEHKLFNTKVVAAQALTVVIWILLIAELTTSGTLSDFIVSLITLSLMIVFGLLLIKSVIGEVEQKEKLSELNQRLKDLDAQKDEFISMAAHELRAPMTAIKGYVSMVLEGDTGDIPEKARGFLADTNNITDRLIRLVNNMLNVSRIEEGRMVYQIEEENMSQVVRTVFSQFRPEAERKGLEYKLEILQKIRDRVRVDPDRIQEVIGNLLSNAVKYTNSGSIKVVLTQPDEAHIRCDVVDTGQGISKEEQTKLFQKFHRVESNVGKTTGTGLGLYICKLLVEKFGGRIGVESDSGGGSDFWFELPLVSTSAT